MSTETLNLNTELYTYMLKTSLREPEVLKQLRIETHKLSTARMQISPEQGQFMGLLSELLGARKTLDIGTYTGYSALAVALSLPPDGKVITCDISTEFTNIGKLFWEKAEAVKKIDLRIAPALATLQKLLDNSEASTFDFAFIDADKTNYSNYYELSLALLRRGGLIAIDNVLWSGRVADPAENDKDTIAIRELNKALLGDQRVTLSMIPIGDGLTLARKR